MEVNNLETDNKLKHAEIALKIATVDRSKFDLGFEKELRSISMDARKESLRQLSTNTNYLLGKWE